MPTIGHVPWIVDRLGPTPPRPIEHEGTEVFNAAEERPRLGFSLEGRHTNWPEMLKNIRLQYDDVYRELGRGDTTNLVACGPDVIWHLIPSHLKPNYDCWDRSTWSTERHWKAFAHYYEKKVSIYCVAVNLRTGEMHCAGDVLGHVLTGTVTLGGKHLRNRDKWEAKGWKVTN